MGLTTIHPPSRSSSSVLMLHLAFLLPNGNDFTENYHDITISFKWFLSLGWKSALESHYFWYYLVYSHNVQENSIQNGFHLLCSFVVLTTADSILGVSVITHLSKSLKPFLLSQYFTHTDPSKFSDSYPRMNIQKTVLLSNCLYKRML